MTMATCSVNLTNCDLAPRLSLCPDSGLLVGKSASITKYVAGNHIMTNSLSHLIGSLTNISTRWWFLNGIVFLSIIVNSIGCRNMCFHLSDISCINIILTPITLVSGGFTGKSSSSITSCLRSKSFNPQVVINHTHSICQLLLFAFLAVHLDKWPWHTAFVILAKFVQCTNSGQRSNLPPRKSLQSPEERMLVLVLISIVVSFVGITIHTVHCINNFIVIHNDCIIISWIIPLRCSLCAAPPRPRCSPSCTASSSRTILASRCHISLKHLCHVINSNR